MSRDPTNVRGAPEDILVAHVKNVAKRQVRVQKITGGRVHHALGLSRAATCVKDVERILRVHRLRGTGTRDVRGGHLAKLSISGDVTRQLTVGSGARDMKLVLELVGTISWQLDFAKD